MRCTRDDGAHGDHRAEHRRRERDPRDPTRDHRRPGASGHGGHRRRRRQDRDARLSADGGAVAEALALVPASVPIVLDPVMVAESALRCWTIGPDGACRDALAAGHGPDAEPPRSSSARGPRARRNYGCGATALTPQDSLVRSVRWARITVVLTGGHRSVASDLFFNGRELVEIRGPPPPRRRRARLGLHTRIDSRRPARVGG